MNSIVLIVVLACSAFAVEGRGWGGGGWGGDSGRHNHGGGGGGWGSGGGWGGNGGGGWGGGGSGSSTAAPSTTTTTTTATPPVGDTRSLNDLHQLALAEGGRVVVYAGGDSPGQQDWTKSQFEKRFPGMTLDIIVDLSKFHDGRIEYQLQNKSLVADVAQLQTVQDFPRWKSQGVFMNYRPIGWEQVYPEMKDDGYYYAITIYVFSNFINTQLLPNNASWPINMQDYLKPEFKGKIVANYPNDDDAVLYWFKQAVDKYGWDYVRKFKEQDVTFVRGTQTANDLVSNGTFPVTMTTEGSLIPDGSNTTFVLPENDPWVFWPQLGGIFMDAPHPNCAKLYMSWLLDAENQASGYSWSIRKDFPPPAGYKDPFAYTQTHIMDFAKWMANRQEVELFRTEIGLILGEVQGPSPTGTMQLGTNPTVALPH